MDEPAANLNRPSVARVRTEINLLKSLPARVSHGTPFGKRFRQSVIYEELLPYYSCFRLGHSLQACKQRSNEDIDRLLVIAAPTTQQSVVPSGLKQTDSRDFQVGFQAGKRFSWQPKDTSKSPSATHLHAAEVQCTRKQQQPHLQLEMQ